MTTIHCPGGHSFSDGEIPSPVAYRLIPDTAVDALVTRVIEAVQKGDDAETVVTYEILSAGFAAYVCPHCGRLLVFRESSGNRADSYQREQ